MQKDMVASLEELGISTESAKLSAYQYDYLQKVDAKVAKEYQRQVSDTVTGLSQRLLSFYKNKIDDEEDIDFLESEYIPMILQNNLNAIIRSFEENYGGVLSDDEEYRELFEDVYISSILTRATSNEGIETLKESISKSEEKEPEKKPSIFERIKEAASSFFGKPKAQATTSQRGTAGKTAKRRGGLIGKAVSAVKSFFRR